MNIDDRIIPLFFSPVYKNNIGDVNIPDFKSLEYRRGNNIWTTYDIKDNYLLESPEFTNLKVVIEKEVDYYFRSVLCVSKGVNFYITNSWINRNDTGDHVEKHHHCNSIISGVLYLETNNDSGNITFVKDTHSNILFPEALWPEMETYNLHNCTEYSITPNNNDIVLFPSSLVHYGSPNLSNKPRYCLSFNVFVYGKLGGCYNLDLKK